MHRDLQVRRPRVPPPRLNIAHDVDDNNNSYPIALLRARLKHEEIMRLKSTINSSDFVVY